MSAPSTTVTSSGLKTPLDVLESVFGYASFRGAQAEVIDSALAGRDTIVLMPTGAGKSLCYQIPSLIRQGTGLVVSPLIALMQDQVVALNELGIRAECLNSALDPERQRDIVARLKRGEIELLYLAPERLLTDRGAAELAGVELSMIAIDEAHCVSQWGHDFRADYLGLNRLREMFPGVPRMALTATADPRSRDEIADKLALDDPAWFVTSFDRPNLTYRVTPKTDATRQLEAFIAGHEGEAGIVYCLSRKKVESVAETLARHGHTALPYHAGLAPEVRSAHQARFLRDEAVVIVATVAFGMGIDKPDVRFVVHLDLPKSMEGYYQETGRAGRDGLPAETLLLFGLQDVVRIRQMVDDAESDEARKRVERAKLDALLGWCETVACRRQSLLAYFGETYDRPCGNCDNCLEPPRTWDATVAAQKLMSTIVRTGQRFGGGHVIDVLTGKSTDKVVSNGHAALPVFGIGTELDERGWRSVARQLVARGYVAADAERFGALSLTEQARPLLRGEVPLELRVDPAKTTRRARGASKDTVARELKPHEHGAWERLRACRKRLADDAGVPPYVVFHDATLIAMLRARPTTLAEMLEVSGVGEAKLEKYGAAFLETLTALDDEASSE